MKLILKHDVISKDSTFALIRLCRIYRTTRRSKLKFTAILPLVRGLCFLAGRDVFSVWKGKRRQMLSALFSCTLLRVDANQNTVSHEKVSLVWKWWTGGSIKADENFGTPSLLSTVNCHRSTHLIYFLPNWIDSIEFVLRQFAAVLTKTAIAVPFAYWKWEVLILYPPILWLLSTDKTNVELNAISSLKKCGCCSSPMQMNSLGMIFKDQTILSNEFGPFTRLYFDLPGKQSLLFTNFLNPNLSTFSQSNVKAKNY